ncbi:MAG TPA: NlpC/P60 family protein [Actinomycetales bacterium]|nr:NlpC/P60 family protein [Actinomycetales bacterium]
MPAGPSDATETSRPTAARLADAQRAAKALRERVDDLELQAALASEDEGEASAQLDEVISQELSAEASLEAAKQTGVEQRALASRRARALYMSGGHTPIVASVLTGTSDDLGDVLVGLRTMRTLVGHDARAVGAAERSIDDAVAGSKRLQQLRLDRQRLETEKAAAAEQLRQLLDQQQALLEESDARVVALMEQQRQEEEAAALRRAVEEAARLQAEAQAAARVSGGTGGAVRGPGVTGNFTVSAPTPAAQAAIEAAMSMRGRPYQWGATGPGTFDCSGLTMWAYRQAGVSIPRTSRSQYSGLPKVPLDQMQPGDLIFFANGSSPSSIHHVGMYLGGGQMVHAPRTGDVVKVSAVWSNGVYGAVRPTG